VEGFENESNYSINILQKIYNNIKKIEVPSFLKSTAYNDPKKFEEYLKLHVYDNFDKYLNVSAVKDIHDFTDYAKSTILQIRNKYMGIIEGKIANLKLNYKQDQFFINYSNSFKLKENIKKTIKNNSKELLINDYCYYKIMDGFCAKIKNLFKKDDINEINHEIFPIIIELTSFLIFSSIYQFNTTFKSDVITDEVISLMTIIPIYLGNNLSMQAGQFCWEWVLYSNKDKIASFLNNIHLSVKSLKQHIKSKSLFYEDEIKSK